MDYWIQEGDAVSDVKLGEACPGCGSTARQRFQWRPDLNPTHRRRRCFDCGYDTGWFAAPTQTTSNEKGKQHER